MAPEIPAPLPGPDMPQEPAAAGGLGVLSGAAAMVSYAAQYRLVDAALHLALAAALEAAIRDAAALVFACPGVTPHHPRPAPAGTPWPPARRSQLMTFAPTPADSNDRDGDRHDVRGRTRHVNRNRSGQDSPRDSHRNRDAGARHRGAGTHDGDRHDNRDGDRHDDVRGQIRRLLAQGGTYRSIAAAAGLAPTNVHDLATGRRAPTPATSRAIAIVNSASLRRARVDAGGTRLRLRALHVMGHSPARIARALGVRAKTVRAIVRGDATAVSITLRDQAASLYDTWGDKRAPERTRAERGAATTARRQAIAGNWCAGAGLDDDELDTPGYKPAARWKPATGTGVAPDVQPPDRRTNRDHPQPQVPDQEAAVSNPSPTHPGTAEGSHLWH